MYMKKYNMGISGGYKGISPLIAAVFLIAMTVAIATSFMGWYSTLLGSQSATVENKTKIGIDCTAARLSILDVYMDFTNNVSRINVRNSGQVDDNIVSIALYNSHGMNATNLSAIPKVINKGDTLSFEFNMTNIIPACGNFSKVIVSSQCKTGTFTSTPKGC